MKNYRIEYQPSAKDDLFAIWLYIARDSIKQADRWAELLKDRSERLSEFPEKSRPYKGEYRLLPIDNGYRPAVMNTAQTGRTHDLHPTQAQIARKILDQRAPSTHDPEWTPRGQGNLQGPHVIGTLDGYYSNRGNRWSNPQPYFEQCVPSRHHAISFEWVDRAMAAT